MNEDAEQRWIVASDVGQRDGIGLELWIGGEMVMEVFRDDTKRVREVTLYQSDLRLELVEEAIAKFKTDVPWDFVD